MWRYCNSKKYINKYLQVAFEINNQLYLQITYLPSETLFFHWTKAGDLETLESPGEHLGLVRFDLSFTQSDRISVTKQGMLHQQPFRYPSVAILYIYYWKLATIHTYAISHTHNKAISSHSVHLRPVEAAQRSTRAERKWSCIPNAVTASGCRVKSAWNWSEIGLLCEEPHLLQH